MKQKKSASILRKFLLFNLLVFSILGLFTILYLKAVQPNLVKKRTTNHITIIKNTSDHLQRLNVKFEKENIKTFLLSTRFLFQSLDRVRFYNNEGNIIGDTNILDLDQTVFSKSDSIIESSIDGIKKNQNKVEENSKNKNSQDEILIKDTISKKYQDRPIVFEKEFNNNFFVSTLDKVKVNNKKVGYIVVTEQANDILFAVEERKNFIIRTVLAVALVILIFSLFLNKYILKPIKLLVLFKESIKAKADKPVNVDKFFIRGDEIGKLTKLEFVSVSTTATTGILNFLASCNMKLLVFALNMKIMSILCSATIFVRVPLDQSFTKKGCIDLKAHTFVEVFDSLSKFTNKIEQGFLLKTELIN